MPNPLTVLEDLSERLHYNVSDFPLYTKEDELKRYGYEAVCHWHPDLEFIYIKKGIMDYFINGKTVRLTQGQGIFVNSERLHYGFSKEHYECTFIALVIHPRIFVQNTEVGNVYMKKKFGLKNPDYIILYPHVAWHKEVLDQILAIHEAMDDIIANPLLIMSRAIMIAQMMGNHIADCEESDHDTGEQMEFLNMTAFIQQHFSEKVSIQDIAAAGAVSRAKACRLFQKFVKTSPNEYLNNYRLMKSIELMRDTHLSMIEISEYCGFQTPSYFASVFRRSKGMTPRQFRANVV